MSKYGLSLWHDPEKAELDIVFVHGLRGHREKTWTKDSVLWPRDLLAADVAEARILSFGYGSGIVHSDTAEVSHGSLVSDAKSLCALLSQVRVGGDNAKRPIIFVAHSLGGLICAQAIILGEKDAGGDSVRAITQHVKGVIFLGTPFASSSVATWGDVVLRIFNVVKKASGSTLKTLKGDANDLEELGMAFPEVIKKRCDEGSTVKVVFFYEELDTNGLRIVDQKSASYPGVGEVLPLRANHLDICRFASKHESGYKQVRAKILQILANGGDTSAANIHHSATLNFFDKAINNAGRDMRVETQTFQFLRD